MKGIAGTSAPVFTSKLRGVGRFVEPVIEPDLVRDRCQTQRSGRGGEARPHVNVGNLGDKRGKALRRVVEDQIQRDRQSSLRRGTRTA